jgi:hypothetical protein
MARGPALQKGGRQHRRFYSKQQAQWQLYVPATSPVLELSQFGTFTGVDPASTILALTVAVAQFTTDANMAPPTYELWDYSGTPAIIGTTQTGTVSLSNGNVDTITWTGVTYAQLATLRVRIRAYQGTANSGAQQLVNWASVSVTFTQLAGLAPAQLTRWMLRPAAAPAASATFT